MTCPSAGECLMVGTYANSSAVEEPVVLSFSDGIWDTVTPGLPGDAAAADNLSVSQVACADPGDCVAVGSYKDSTGDVQGLLLVESAGTWSTEAAPLPASSDATPDESLEAVSCPGPEACVAVGTYASVYGARQGVAVEQSPSGWTATGFDAPATASGDYVLDLDTLTCPAPGQCEGGGQYEDPIAGQLGMTATEASGAWTVAASYYDDVLRLECPAVGACATLGQALGEEFSVAGGGQSAAVSAPEGGFFTSFSCTTIDYCVVVGGTPTSASSSATSPYAVTYSGGTFTEADPPLPAGAPAPTASTPAELVSVSCQENGACSGLGTYWTASGSLGEEVVYRDGATWSAAAVPLPAGPHLASPPSIGFACGPDGACVAASSATNSFAEPVSLISSGSGASWKTIDAPIPATAGYSPITSMNAVTCATSCVAVGTTQAPQGLMPSLVVETGTPGKTWTAKLVTISGLGDRPASLAVSSVSCDGSTICAATASLATSPSQGILLVETGGKWTPLSLPTPAGDQNFFPTGVACLPSKVCIAVTSDPSILVVASGTSPQEIGLPTPSGASGTPSTSTVSCASTFCVIATSFKDSAGIFEVLIDTYSDGSWSSRIAPMPPNASGVGNAFAMQASCTAADCSVVGSYTDTTGAVQPFLLQSADGLSWQVAEAALPLETTYAPAGELDRVSCSVARCASVGLYRVSKYTYREFLESLAGNSMTATGPLPGQLAQIGCGADGACASYRWIGRPGKITLVFTPSGTTWSAATAPVPAGGQIDGTELTGVACDAAGGCVVVGSYTMASGPTIGVFESGG